MAPSRARGDIAVENGSESAVYMSYMSLVEHGGGRELGGFDVHRHGSSPSPLPSAARTNRRSAGAALSFNERSGFDWKVDRKKTRQTGTEPVSGPSRAVVQPGLLSYRPTERRRFFKMRGRSPTMPFRYGSCSSLRPNGGRSDQREPDSNFNR